jgi:hypothetical protein
MNMCEALQAIDVMLPLAPLLRKGGFIVMTWKLPKYALALALTHAQTRLHSHSLSLTPLTLTRISFRRMDVNLDIKTEALTASFAERFAGFEIVRVIWLLANMYERTVVARKIVDC